MTSTMLAWRAAFVLVTLCACLTAMSLKKSKPTSFCKRGFQIAARYHECWMQATAKNPYSPLYVQQDVYDSKFVEDYAKHMCSVVKPEALLCLREEVKRCENSHKLMVTADDSGGACTRNHLNPFFKFHIIDRLKPVSGDSDCMMLDAYECYSAAGTDLMQSGVQTVDIDHFHNVADRFFDHVWQCMIKVFKSKSDVCPNWQIPMLLELQRTSMPSLFGMRLNNDQVYKLELEPDPTSHNTVTGFGNCTHGNCMASHKVYVLLRVLAEKPEPRDGDIVLELDASSPDKPQVGVVNSAVDANNFLAEIMSGKDQVTLKEIRQIKKEQRRKDKEIKKYLKQLKDSKRKNAKGFKQTKKAPAKAMKKGLKTNLTT